MDKAELINECCEQITYDLPYSTIMLLMEIRDHLLNTAVNVGLCNDCKHKDRIFSGKSKHVIDFCNYHERRTKDNCFLQ